MSLVAPAGSVQRRPRSWTVPLAAALSLALPLVVAPAPAWANGRYPAAGQIAVHPGDPETLLVRTTYGLLLRRGSDQPWGWICEGAVGFGGDEDPMVSFTADGTLLAGIFEGLSVSRDACQWSFAGGGLAGHYVTDLAVDKGAPHSAVLVISNSVPDGNGGSHYLGQVWETADDGATWAQAGVDLPDDLLSLTLDTAPSDPQRIYVSGRLGPPDYPGVLARSDDRGATWQTLPIPGSDDQSLPYIGAIDPTRPDRIYVRLDGGAGDRLVVSDDGGLTWTQAFAGAGDLLGFALSPDGATVAIGGADDGLWTAPSSSLSFARVSDTGVRCLTWASSGLLACADEATDHFTAGISTDGGASFTAVVHLGDLCGPAACGAESSVGSACPAQWPVVAATIGAADCSAPDGGAGGQGGGGGGGGAAGSGGPAESSGGCAVGPGAREGGALGGLCAAALFLLRRRKRAGA